MANWHLTAEQQAEVCEQLERFGRMEALLVIRQATGVDLAEAIRILDEIDRVTGLRELREERLKEMGMSAEIVAIGPFSPDVVEYLEYPPRSYAGTKPGTPVIVALFGIIEGSSMSRVLASAVGIDDAWDFNQHKIDPQKIDFPMLHERLGHEYLRDIQALEVMKNHGFEFYFRPCG